MVDENLVFYEEWELEACVDGALLEAQMDRVNMVPFTYQQLDVFKRKLDQVVGDGLMSARWATVSPGTQGVAAALTVTSWGSSTHRGTLSP